MQTFIHNKIYYNIKLTMIKTAWKVCFQMLFKCRKVCDSLIPENWRRDRKHES